MFLLVYQKSSGVGLTPYQFTNNLASFPGSKGDRVFKNPSPSRSPSMFTLWEYAAIRIVRKTCEHFCFGGAAVDLAGFLTHNEATMIVAAGKIAFVVGSLGVYLMHAEEARRARHVVTKAAPRA